jgi:hypothetical protein
MRNTAGWVPPKLEELSDIESIRTQINFDLTDEYYQLLKDNNLDPELHEPTFTYEESDAIFKIIVGIKPIKRIGGIPINKIKFTD